MTKIDYSLAAAGDADAIVQLLRDCALPDQDIHEHLRHFVVARDGERLVGVIGLQICGHAALLRSLAVQQSYRGAGIANALVARIVALAYTRGIASLYLLTTTAQAFFSRLGFLDTARDAVPDEILATQEFQSLCPSSAACMTRDLVSCPVSS